MTLQLPDIGVASLKSLVSDMDTKGYGMIANFVAPAELSRMRAFVSSAVEKAGQQYVAFTGADAVKGSSLEEFSASDAFCSMVRRLYQEGTGHAPPEAEFYQVLRCLTGSTARAHSLRFHYDSYVVTALIPIEMPTDGQTGDLIMLPNTRRIRQFYAINLLDKIIVDNSLFQKLLRFVTQRGIVPVTRIKMIPGNLYVFWGYRSIHTNEACDPDKVRATALFHYADPHKTNRLKVGLRGSRLRRHQNHFRPDVLQG